MGDLSKNFSRHEFECGCGCVSDTVDAELLEVLQDIRHHFDRSIKITSSNRCEAHNKAVGGGIRSQHLKGRAADIKVGYTNPYDVQEYLLKKYPDKYGIGRYERFTHIDTRTGKARWDQR